MEADVSFGRYVGLRLPRFGGARVCHVLIIAHMVGVFKGGRGKFGSEWMDSFLGALFLVCFGVRWSCSRGLICGCGDVYGVIAGVGLMGVRGVVGVGGLRCWVGPCYELGAGSVFREVSFSGWDWIGMGSCMLGKWSIVFLPSGAFRARRNLQVDLCRRILSTTVLPLHRLCDLVR